MSLNLPSSSDITGADANPAALLQHLQDQNERYRDTIENAVEGIIQTSPDGKFLSVNRAYANFLGYDSPQELMEGITQIDVQIYVDSQVRRDFLCRLVAHGTARCEYQAWTKGGLSTKWLLASARTVRDKRGQVLYFESIVEDITERREQMHRLEHLTSKLQRSNADLQRFASRVAHDLSQPLNTVFSACELLSYSLGHALSADTEDSLEYLMAAVVRMKTTISDILDFSRVDTSAPNLKLCDLNVLLQNVITDLGASIAAEQAHIFWDGLPHLLVDEVKLSRLFLNLISNALRYRRAEAPRITISAISKQREWIFCVEDNGKGFAQEDSVRIFDLFERLDVAQPGTGLGLSMCKQIIESHHGRIWAESLPGIGTKIIFTLSNDPAR